MGSLARRAQASVVIVAQSPADLGAVKANSANAHTEGRGARSSNLVSPHPAGVSPRRPGESQPEIWVASFSLPPCA